MTENQQADDIESMAQTPPWALATIADAAELDFEEPIAASKSANSSDLSDLFSAAEKHVNENGAAEPAATRIFGMLSAITGMSFKPRDRDEPFGAMAVFGDRRTAIPSDFRGEPVDLLAHLAERAKHPVLRARLADVCWLLDRQRGRLGLNAIAAYVDIVRRVDSGEFTFRFDKGQGALKHDARDLLRRALSLARALGWDKTESLAARNVVSELRALSLKKLLPIPSIWFSELDLEFGVSDPAKVGADLDALLTELVDVDSQQQVELWRVTSRAYHFAKREDDKHRCKAMSAEQLVAMADRSLTQQHSAMLASHHLSAAIAELHSVPGKKDRRRELRHRLIDVQAGISEEMSAFSHEMDLEEIAKQVEQALLLPTLLDKLFVFAALSQSPQPGDLARSAAESIKEHPLSSLFAGAHHDREGKVVHRTEGGGFGGEHGQGAIQEQISQAEGVRRQITVFGEIEVARRAIISDHYVSDDVLLELLLNSPFVPDDLTATFSRGFARFFQGDHVSALYILTPLLENSLRHLLKLNGHDVTIFDDTTQTQKDRPISSLFEQMRTELDAVFGAALTTDIENVFLRKPGPYLRHAVAHGLLHDGDPYGPNAIYGCWLMFRLCLLPLFPRRAELRLSSE